MEAAKAQNWAVEPKEGIILFIDFLSGSAYNGLTFTLPPHDLYQNYGTEFDEIWCGESTLKHCKVNGLNCSTLNPTFIRLHHGE
jgi:hypothetical protein